MTNRDKLITALRDGFDDPGMTMSVIGDSVNCPYYETSGHPCDDPGWKYNSGCDLCKLEWLDKEAAG